MPTRLSNDAGRVGVEERKVVLGVITGAQGIQGDVRIKPFTAEPDGLKHFSTVEVKGHPLTLKQVRVQPKGVIVRFAEISDRTKAETLRGAELTVPRSALNTPEDGSIYHADLIGLSVVTPAGDHIGTVVAVENYGAGDILEIELPTTKRVMAPFQDVAVLDVDLVHGKLTLAPEFLA